MTRLVLADILGSVAIRESKRDGDVTSQSDSTSPNALLGCFVGIQCDLKTYLKQIQSKSHFEGSTVGLQCARKNCLCHVG